MNDVQTSSGVGQDEVGRGLFCCFEGGDADGRNVFRNAVGVEAELFLLGQNLELIDRGGTIKVARNQERIRSFFLQQAAKFRSGGRLARTVETDPQNTPRTFDAKRGRAFTQKPYQLIVGNFVHFLAWLDSFKNFLADALLLNALNEFAGYLEVDVGGKQGSADFLEGFRHVFLG